MFNRRGCRRSGCWNVLHCCFVGALIASTPAHAEGGDKRTNGDWGVNRRVRSLAGYVGAEGTFAAMTPAAPPTDETGKVTKISNPFHCGYSFYLGCGDQNPGFSDLEVDAGLQWEDRDAQSGIPDDRWVGWVAFINNSRRGSGKAYTNPQWLSPAGWQAWRGKNRQPTYELTFLVTQSGYLGLTISGPNWPGGTFYWMNSDANEEGNRNPPAAIDQVLPSISQLLARRPIGIPYDDEGILVLDVNGDVIMLDPPAGTSGDEVVSNSSEFNSIFVKRSVCITQATGVTGQCDGTQFDCQLSAGKVYPANTREPTAWTQRQNQLLTGYDVQEFGAELIDQSFAGMATPGSKFKMAFPALGKPARQPGSETLYPGRYVSEEAYISLINGAYPVAGTVKPSTP